MSWYLLFFFKPRLVRIDLGRLLPPPPSFSLPLPQSPPPPCPISSLGAKEEERRKRRRILLPSVRYASQRQFGSFEANTCQPYYDRVNCFTASVGGSFIDAILQLQFAQLRKTKWIIRPMCALANLSSNFWGIQNFYVKSGRVCTQPHLKKIRRIKRRGRKDTAS